MGKVKEEKKVAGKPSKLPEGRPGGSKARQVAHFFGNFLSTRRYLPNQGKRARPLTALGFGILAAAGVYTLYQQFFSDERPATRYTVPTLIALGFAWIIWRIVEYPPFADFLIGTEAEMKKVSWTSKADLIRATTVVLATVVILALFLLGVDVVWSTLLRFIGVLRLGSDIETPG